MAINPTDAIQAYNAAARSAGVRGVGPSDPMGANGASAGGFQSLLQSQMAQGTADPLAGQLAAANLVGTPNPALTQAPVVPGLTAPNTLGQLIRGSIQQTIDITKQSENMSMGAIAGQTDMRDLVMAVANAELTLQTVVTVRDKVINAYNEIIKMPL